MNNTKKERGSVLFFFLFLVLSLQQIQHIDAAASRFKSRKQPLCSDFFCCNRIDFLLQGERFDKMEQGVHVLFFKYYEIVQEVPILTLPVSSFHAAPYRDESPCRKATHPLRNGAIYWPGGCSGRSTKLQRGPCTCSSSHRRWHSRRGRG